MTCYLTDATDPDDLAAGFADGVFTAPSSTRRRDHQLGERRDRHREHPPRARADAGRRMVFCVHGE
jgi:dihydroorotase